jgi:hypothetical protein
MLYSSRMTGPSAAALCAADGASASEYLRGQHRRLEQILLLLAADIRADGKTIARVAADVTAHLDAEEDLLRPLLERAWRCPVANKRALHGGMHRSLAKLAISRSDGPVRRTLLRELVVAFREHARLVDGVALPWIEDAMSPATLVTLHGRLRTLHELSRRQHGGALRVIETVRGAGYRLRRPA